jgi:hypothetical protein
LAPAKVAKLVKTAQFYWFLSHVFTVLFFIIYTLLSFFSPPSSLKYYRFCLLLILSTYLMVIRQLKKKTWFHMVADENVHYFLLAGAMYLGGFKIGPLSGGLYSFIIFSVFHILNYFQSNLVEVFFTSAPAQQHIHASISHFVAAYNQQALLMAANAEMLLLLMGANPLLLLPSIITSLFRGDVVGIFVRLAMFFVVLVFNKIRYDNNQFTKVVIDQWDMKMQQLVASVPQYSWIYNLKFKQLVRKYVGPIRVPTGAKVASKQN